MSENAKPFMPPRGGLGSQGKNADPVPSAFWQPPEEVNKRDFWRFNKGAIFLGWSAGVPVGRNDDRHLITVAGARAGKTSTLLIPNLHLYEGAAVVIDPKGELASKTAQYRAEKLGHKVHVLDPWGVADVPDNLRSTYNPLKALAAGDPLDLIDDCSMIAEALIQEQGENSSHWTNAGRDFVRAAIMFLVSTDKNASLARLPEFIADCVSITTMERQGEDEDFGENALAYMANYEGGKGELEEIGEVIRNAGRGMMGTPVGERGSILSTVRNQLGFLESPQIRKSLAESSFNMKSLKRLGSKNSASYFVGKNGDVLDDSTVTVYLCLPASRMGTHAKWLRLFLNMAMAALERDNRVPELPILFMLEEFAALGHMRALEQASAYMAGFGVKLWVVLQDLTQLKRHYRDGWETFIANAGLLNAFGLSDMTSLEYFSKRLGETYSYVKESVNQSSGAAASGAPTVRENFQKVPLITPDEIAIQFGRRHSRAILLAADAPPIAVDRRFYNEADFVNYRKN